MSSSTYDRHGRVVETVPFQDDLRGSYRPVRPIGEIDSACPVCSKPLNVDMGSGAIYPHSAALYCECGYIRKATLTEVRAAIVAASERKNREFGYTDRETGLIADAKADERDRIRAELIDWLAPKDPDPDLGPVLYIHGRRIADEIDRICPKE